MDENKDVQQAEQQEKGIADQGKKDAVLRYPVDLIIAFGTQRPGQQGIDAHASTSSDRDH